MLGDRPPGDVDVALATAVVGAGPAGLLFALVGRLLAERRALPVDRWALGLFDKREQYARTHRLRMDPRPYRELQRALDDPRYDRLLEFLDQRGFSPGVNALEEHLVGTLAELGVRKEILCFGGASGEIDLRALVARLEAPRDARLTVVGADSVHSTVRETVFAETSSVRGRHEHVVRLRIRGPALPERLGAVQQYKLAKLLTSILDYRRNAGGFGEVDLFLPHTEHAAVASFGATPKQPIALVGARLRQLRAPLFLRIVEALARGFGDGPCEVELQSTFVLEHIVAPRRVRVHDDPRVDVFLVGDAAVSLPFFRGMACLGSCVHALARAHCDLLATLTRASPPHDLLGSPRPLVLGGRPLPGRIVQSVPTWVDGRPAQAVLHRWLGRWGMHLLVAEGSGWHAVHRRAPVRRAVAERELAAWIDPVKRYDREVEAIARAELRIVRARGAIIRGARELVRASALVPLPVGGWWLSMDPAAGERDAVSPGLLVNVVLAMMAAVLASFGAFGVGALAQVAAIAALVVQLAGGVAYRVTRAVEHAPGRWVRNVWQLQLATMFAIGVAAVMMPTLDGSGGRFTALVAWGMLVVALIVGVYASDRLGRRWLESAEL